MNRFIVIISFISLYLAACKSDDKKSAATDDPAIPVAQKFSDAYFFKTLEGSVAGKPIVMHLLKTRDGVTANYYYVEQGQTIFLNKDWNKTGNDSIYLFEVSTRNFDESPAWAMTLQENGVAGVWTGDNGKSTYTFELKESSVQPTLHFNAASYIDSATYLKYKTDTPTLKSAVSLVSAIDNTTEASWLNSRLKHIVDNGNKKFNGLSLPQVAEALVKADVDGYKAEIDSSTVGIDDKGPHYFLNREYQVVSNILYNQNGYVCLSMFNYAYTGGAHGNYGTTMYCFDVTAQKQLSLTDIVSADSVQLQTLLEQHYRRQYNLSAGSPLDQRLFVKHLAPNKNFYFSPAGLGFVYTPYEVASYADGEINVWIPFTELKPHLNPVFAKRMNL